MLCQKDRGGGRTASAKPNSGTKTKSVSEMSISEAKEAGRYLEKIEKNEPGKETGNDSFHIIDKYLMSRYDSLSKREFKKVEASVKRAEKTFGTTNIAQVRGAKSVVTRDGRIWNEDSAGQWLSSSRYDNKGEIQSNVPYIQKQGPFPPDWKKR